MFYVYFQRGRLNWHVLLRSTLQLACSVVCVINIVCSGYWYSSLGETSLQQEKQAGSLDVPLGVAINLSCRCD